MPCLLSPACASGWRPGGFDAACDWDRVGRFDLLFRFLPAEWLPQSGAGRRTSGTAFSPAAGPCSAIRAMRSLRRASRFLLCGTGWRLPCQRGGLCCRKRVRLRTYRISNEVTGCSSRMLGHEGHNVRLHAITNAGRLATPAPVRSQAPRQLGRPAAAASTRFR